MRTPARQPRPRTRANRGFTLVELAVVLGVLGLLAVGMSSAFDSIGQARQHNAARAHAEAARQALHAFAMHNKRLPCPDNSIHGDVAREAAGSTCDGTTNIGWLPYESLGMDVPVRAARLRYGVHRGSIDTDLVAPRPHAIDRSDLEGSGGFIAALSTLAAAPASTGQPHYISGDGGGVPTCTASGGGTVTVNPAFVLVAPVGDRDGTGGSHPGFDSIHRSFAEGNSRCVAAPDTPASASYDDVVVAESATALLGWVMTVTR